MAETKIPDAELELLTCLHRRGEATARELREDLRTQRPMAHGSVLTLLGRLERRGLVSRRKALVGKAYVYAPTRQAAAPARALLKRLLNRIFDGNPVDLMASLFDSRPPTARELDDLHKLVTDLRKKRAHGGQGGHGGHDA